MENVIRIHMNPNSGFYELAISNPEGLTIYEAKHERLEILADQLTRYLVPAIKGLEGT